MKFLLLSGRILYSMIFFFSSFHHFTRAAAAYAAMQGVPAPSVLVPLSGIMALVGSISIIIGYKAKAGGWLIVLFLIPVTLMMHNFWAVADPLTRQIQQAMFFKNLSMLGGALIIAYFGAGPLSVDAAIASNKKERR